MFTVYFENAEHNVLIGQFLTLSEAQKYGRFHSKGFPMLKVTIWEAGSLRYTYAKGQELA